MKKILIIGSDGVGKTTLGKAIVDVGTACHLLEFSVKETQQHLQVLKKAMVQQTNVSIHPILSPKQFGQSLKKRKFK